MRIRALIIAIEKYPLAEGMQKDLPGSLAAGIGFREWLVARAAAENHTIEQLYFCSNPAQPGGRGANQQDIVSALLEIKNSGKQATDELFVFFSGHGYRFAKSGNDRADAIIAADFVNAALSAHCCINLDHIIDCLRFLGPGRHYYFVDACRNVLDVAPSQPLGVSYLDTIEEASSFILQSTAPGEMAPVGIAFPQALLEGLRGRGVAKAWNPTVNDAMFVRYDSLKRYVQERLQPNQRVYGNPYGGVSESDAVFATIKPVPTVKCKVEIAGASGTNKGTVNYIRGREGAPKSAEFEGTPPTLVVQPDAYTVSVSLQSGIVTPPTVVKEVYDDCDLKFKMVHTLGFESTTGADSGPSSLDIVVPMNAHIDLKNLSTGKLETMLDSKRIDLPPGRYSASLRDDNKRLLHRSEIVLRAGKSHSVDPMNWQESAPRRSIAERLPKVGGGVTPDFSESLRGVAVDPDLNVWLAILGAGRITGGRGDYQKLAQFPLCFFGNEPPGASPVYVLAAFEDPETELRVSVSDTAQARWQSAAQPEGMAGIRHAYASCSAGPKLVSFKIGDNASYTVASATLNNRGTLLTLTLDDDGEFCVSQYLLPLAHLIGQLDPSVRHRIESRNHLTDVRFIAQASRAFRKRRNFAKEFSNDAELIELLYAKWLDPIGASLASYELLRRGKADQLDVVVDNMLRHFPDFPDTNALATFQRRQRFAPNGPPLFFDGLRAFATDGDWLPLPASHLDYASPWTAWRAAIT